MSPLDIVRIPVLNDNYVWLVHDPDSQATMVVDPAVAEPVLEAAGIAVAAASLVVAGKAENVRDGMVLAARSLDEGGAARALEKLVAVSNQDAVEKA